MGDFAQTVQAMNLDAQTLLQGLTITGAGIVSLLGAYIGVRVGYAEMKRDIANLQDMLKDVSERLRYLERRPDIGG